MIIEAAGRDGDDRPQVARWSLVADAGDGPYVPTLPALALVRRLVSARATLPVGARIGDGLLPLDAIAAEFTRLRITTTTEIAHPLVPFEAALAGSFETLPDAVKRVHRAGAVTRLAGMAQAEGAQTPIAALDHDAFRSNRPKRM